MYGEWSQYWWKNITGAKIVVTKVARNLLYNSCVVLIVPSDLPWRQAMRSEIATMYWDESETSEIQFEEIDAEDDYPDDSDIGAFLLKRFSPSLEIQFGFRSKGKVTIQEYIKDNEILKNKIIWIKGINGDCAKQWIEFCELYSSKSVDEGLFVIEVHDISPVSCNSNLLFVNYSDYISRYDVQLFNQIVLSDGDIQDEKLKEYIAAVAANLCESDAEISELLIRNTDFTKENPETGIARIEESGFYYRRGKEKDSGHILALYRNKMTAEIKHRIWISQVQTLFPIIEIERNEIIKRYEKEIESVLDRYTIIQFCDRIYNPYEVELTTLVDLLYKGLYLTSEEIERIKFLRKCRNSLAHMKLCTPEQVTKLLKV